MKRQKSILIVDDEVEIGETLRDCLEPVYEEVVYCGNPKEAVELLSKRAFSLTIVDVNMPAMRGPDFVREVRALGRLDPIVFLTGNSTHELALSALRLAVADVLDKPVHIEDLLKSIDRIFDMEKRKYNLLEADVKKAVSEDNLNRQKKMIGLLHVANDKKKIG